MKLAKIFKWIFQISFIRKHYFGIYSKILKPYNVFKGQTEICRYDGDLKMKVDLDDWIQQQVYFFGVYDTLSINFLKTQLKPGDYFFDVGANVGCFSLIASKCVGNNGKVFAFEPVKRVYTRLYENIELNRLNNISVITKALNETDSTLRLYLASQENLGMSSIQEHDAMSGEVVEIPAISLDNFIASNNITKVDFIKIDIEGAELSALKGMVNTIRVHQPVFLVEISEGVLKEKSERNQIFTFFELFNYMPFVISAGGVLTLVEKDESGDNTNYIFKPS